MFILLLTASWLCGLAVCQRQLEYRLLEEMPARTTIGNLGMDASLGKQYDDSILRTLSYSFLSKSGLHVRYLAVEPTTGILRTTAVIDREVICPGLRHCKISVDIAVSPVQYLQIINVVVHVLDINDNTPKFSTKKLRLEIPENQPPGVISVIPAAQDPDSSNYGLQGYLLSPEAHDKFVIDVLDTKDVQLTLRRRLDRETVPSYQFKIIAFDGGQPKQSGSVDVTVIITDINDNSPKFTNESYTGYVFENATARTNILRVRAEDPDSGLNGKVVYGFASSTKVAYGDLFGISSVTGDIYIKNKVEYSRGPMLHLIVTARDKGPVSVPQSTRVTIFIVDINDHTPYITVNTLTGSNTVHIRENSDRGTFIAQITVVDQDAGKNGQFHCKMNDRNFEVHDISPTNFKITTARPLDRELREKYVITFRCTDRGNFPLSSSRKITVVLRDENDNPPSFSTKIISVDLEENNKVGVFIVQVNASDADYGSNADITYSVDTQYAELVSIHPMLGTVTAKVSFDREKTQKLEIPVIATDSGEPPKSGIATILLALGDVNDCAPMFSQSNYAFGIYENLPPGTEVGRVFATDSDSLPYNKFIYSIVDGDGQGTFYIDPETGRLTTRTALDRENVSMYSFVFAVTDTHNPNLSHKANASVYVADRNDNAPTIKFPNGHNSSVLISSSLPAGYTVTRVEATDIDSGSNAWIKYFLVDPSGLFNIEENTGTILVQGDLRKFNGKTMNIEVVVKDNGEPPNEAKSTLNVIINDTIIYFEAEPQTEAENDILFLALSIALVVMLIILTVVLVLIIRRQCRKAKRRQGYISGNLVRITRPQVDEIRKHGTLYCSEYNTENPGVPPHLDESYMDSTEKTYIKGSSTPETASQRDSQDNSGLRSGIITNGILGTTNTDTTSPARMSRDNSGSLSRGRHRTPEAQHYDRRSSGTTDRSRRARAYGSTHVYNAEVSRRDSDSACSADVSNVESMNGESDGGTSSTLKPSDAEHAPDRRRYPTRGSRDRMRKSPTSSRHQGSHNRYQHQTARGRRQGQPDGSSNTDESKSDSSNQHKIALVHPQRNDSIPSNDNTSDHSSPTDTCSCQGSCGSCQDDEGAYHMNMGSRYRDVQPQSTANYMPSYDKQPSSRESLKPVPKPRVSKCTRPKTRLDDETDNSSSSGSFVEDSDFNDPAEEARDILV